jgi:hypothetical protein
MFKEPSGVSLLRLKLLIAYQHHGPTFVSEATTQERPEPRRFLLRGIGGGTFGSTILYFRLLQSSWQFYGAGNTIYYIEYN